MFRLEHKFGTVTLLNTCNETVSGLLTVTLKKRTILNLLQVVIKISGIKI